MHASTFPRAYGLLTLTSVRRGQIEDFSKILAQATQKQNQPGGSANFFDGNFRGGDGFINTSDLNAMTASLQSSMTPEIRDSMNAMLNELRTGNSDALKNMLGGDMGPRMGVMAFGVGENKRGKKVARAAKYEYNEKGESISKDFFEQQLEADDVQLPKETVEDYSTADAIEVEFVDDQKMFDRK